MIFLIPKNYFSTSRAQKTSFVLEMDKGKLLFKKIFKNQSPSKWHFPTLKHYQNMTKNQFLL